MNGNQTWKSLSTKGFLPVGFWNSLFVDFQTYQDEQSQIDRKIDQATADIQQIEEKIKNLEAQKENLIQEKANLIKSKTQKDDLNSVDRILHTDKWKDCFDKLAQSETNLLAEFQLRTSDQHWNKQSINDVDLCMILNEFDCFPFLRSISNQFDDVHLFVDKIVGEEFIPHFFPQMKFTDWKQLQFAFYLAVNKQSAYLIIIISF